MLVKKVLSSDASKFLNQRETSLLYSSGLFFFSPYLIHSHFWTSFFSCCSKAILLLISHKTWIISSLDSKLLKDMGLTCYPGAFFSSTFAIFHGDLYFIIEQKLAMQYSITNTFAPKSL